ncbi:hypothetical protein ABIB45_000629 [Arthrobacter sp. UYCo732]
MSTLDYMQVNGRQGKRGFLQMAAPFRLAE